MRHDTRRLVSFPVHTVALSLAAWLGLAGAGTASAQNAGWLGPSYAGAESLPTGSKPESKLWWNDGIWWGCLWSSAGRSFTIHRLIVSTQTWHDTGTAIDSRPKSRADCLWNGTKLYVASHQYTDGVGGPGHSLQLHRYSYDPNRDRYSLDVGFPALIGDAKSETLVIDQDSTGRLWAVWTAGLRVWMSHSQGDDRSWSAPVVHPRSTSALAEDDVVSLVAFGGGRIGVMWSDQVQEAFLFTFHQDGAPADAWSPLETVLAGPAIAEDDFCLRASRDGRVFAALMTNTDEVRLEVRSPAGAWSDHLVASDQDDWCHPIVVLDEEERSVHVFGTRPVATGSIHEKTSSMDALSFASGGGTVVMRDASRLAIKEASSTKQAVSGSTGLVVLASHQPWQRYVHHHDSLGGPRPAVPVAAFRADAREGFAPVTVQFLEASSGQPTAWSWAFGDGATSTQRHPVHTYAQPGSYTVTLRATNALGTDFRRRIGLVQVAAPPTSLVLHPIGDAHAFEGQPDSNRGGLETLHVRGGREMDYRAFLKFFVPPSSSHVAAAELRLVVLVDGDDNGTLHLVDDDWEEPTLTWNHMPVMDAPALGHFADANPGTTVALDVGAAVSASGTVSFGIQSPDYHSVIYGSRQGPTPPELRLELVPGVAAAPEAAFEANRWLGEAPLTVQFFDTSNGRVDAWLWDFGDGATSDLQNPSHVFARPGRYAVRLTASNAHGAHTASGAQLVEVGPPAPLPPAPAR